MSDCFNIMCPLRSTATEKVYCENRCALLIRGECAVRVIAESLLNSSLQKQEEGEPNHNS